MPLHCRTYTNTGVPEVVLACPRWSGRATVRTSQAPDEDMSSHCAGAMLCGSITGFDGPTRILVRIRWGQQGELCPHRCSFALICGFADVGLPSHVSREPCSSRWPCYRAHAFYMFTAPYGLATRTLSLTEMFHRHEGLMILRITYIPVG